MDYEVDRNVHSTKQALQKYGRLGSLAFLVCATSLNPPDSYTVTLQSVHIENVQRPHVRLCKRMTAVRTSVKRFRCTYRRAAFWRRIAAVSLRTWATKRLAKIPRHHV